MRPGFLRNASTAVAGPLVVAAALAAAMVGLAELTGVTTLDESFEAGGERVIDVQMTLVAYLCAAAVVVGATAVPPPRRKLRRIPPVAAAVGALAAIPLVTGRATEFIGGLATDAVLAGAVVGGLAAFLLAPLGTRALLGVSAHLAVLWVAALVSVATTETVVYAGLVRPLGATALDDLFGDALGRHVPTLLPYAVLVVVVTAVLGRVLPRRGVGRVTGRSSGLSAGQGVGRAAGRSSGQAASQGSGRVTGRSGGRGAAVLAAAAAPVLAAVLYPVVGMDLWNGEAAPVAAVAAVAGAVAAMLAATPARRSAAPEEAAPKKSANKPRAAG